MGGSNYIMRENIAIQRVSKRVSGEKSSELEMDKYKGRW